MRDPMTRVLFVTPTVPAPNRESGSRRTYQLIKILLSARKDVVVLAENANDPPGAARALRHMGVCVWAGRNTAYAGAEFASDAWRLLETGPYSHIVFMFWYSAELWLERIREVSPDSIFIVDSLDLHFLRRSRHLSNAANRPSDRDIACVGNEGIREFLSYSAADLVLTVSAKEAQYIDDFTGIPGLAMELRDFEDTRIYCPLNTDMDEREGLLFLGNFRHNANIEAAQYLMDEIVPELDRELVRKHPVRIVGNEIERLPRRDFDPRIVKYVGWVPEVLPYLRQSLMSLAPIRHGAGTKRKIIQSMMTGTPVVTTTIGVEGIDVTPGVHLEVHDDPRAFASAVNRLASSKELWHSYAIAGREHAVFHNDESVVRRQLERVLSHPKRKTAQASR